MSAQLNPLPNPAAPTPSRRSKRYKRKASDARIAAALIANGGNCSEVGRVLRMARQSIEERVGRSPVLQAAMAEGERTFDAVAEGEMVRAIKNSDGAMVRYYLDRRVAKYRPKWVEQDNAANAASADPEKEALRQIAVRALTELVETRAREGKAPLFAKPIPALAGPQAADGTSPEAPTRPNASPLV